MSEITIPKINSRQKGLQIQYYTTIPTKYSETGKRHQITGASEDEVKKKFRKEAKRTMTGQVDLEKHKNDTVAQVVEMFLEFAKGDIKKQTHSRYYRAYVNYVKDSSFGKIPARKIKKYHCDDFIRTLTNGTIVYSYVCQIKCIVSQAFDYACDREIMSWNFMRKVKINEDRCKEQEDKELGVWEDDEINTLQSGSMACWNKCRKYRNSPALFILCGTGLRLGELLALKWSKVDLEHRTIKIERTQTEYTDYDTNSKIYEESTPKNKTSRRTIVINDFTYKWLMEQKRRTEQAGIESEYVIPANSGRMVKESSITSTFKAFCNCIGVEYKPSHTCRRSYVTNCLDKGMKLALVSKNVGHKNKSTTLNTYYKCKNDYEDNLAIQNEIFKIYDFDFGGEQVEAMFA
ncbi:MAG: site-specific integrase [Lachnospiraceae bacterium]|nr:site-specific integrase [Lachnospiraceae bacterium]